MNYPKFVIFLNAGGMYYFRLYTDKNKELLSGIPCEQRYECVAAIRELYQQAEKDHHYRMQTAGHQFYYQLTDSTHAVIATSVRYRTMSGMAFGIHSLKRNVAVAVIEDHQPVQV
jgi:uncharacterized protein YegP (UPF0339 family)